MTETNTDATTLKAKLLRHPLRLLLFAIGAAAAVALVLGVFAPKKKDEYRAEAVRQTTITRAVSASGAIEAVDSVTIGSEVSGQIRDVLADFNQLVKKGQLLAVIDTQTFEARVRQAQAQRDAAEADARVAESNYDRQKRLAEGGLVAQKTLEDAVAQRERARASLRQAQATLTTALADLAKANIRSPIDGVIVNRTIEPGQTVAASLNAPELFVVAKDLARMQIKISVDEADIGEVREGQMVRFTVDAFPDENFEGRVTQVRKQPEKSANVVTYVVIAEAANPGKKLLPGMTANADIVLEEHPNVLAAPAAGLRWRPDGAQSASAGASDAAGASGAGMTASGGGGFGAAPGAARMGPFGGSIEQSPLFKDIKLDATQKASIEKIQDGMRTKMRALFQQSGGDFAKMRELMGKERESMNAQIAAVLKPEQKTQFAANQKAMQAQMAAAGGPAGAGAGQAAMQQRTLYVLVNNAPKEVRVLAGVTDGALTEIRAVEAGAIKEGDMVITGKVGAASASTQQQSGQGGGAPRMMPFGGP